jgi:glycosyltransferase involved in cell wall biosynthesis
VLVSVIVPTFDRGHRLVNAVESALAQTFTELEVIVVDDGSTDGTGALVAERYGTEPRVLYVEQEHAGVARARNTGLARARGEIIAFLDSDDRWRPWKLALQLECLARVPSAGMIWTEMEAIDPSGNPIPGSSLADILDNYGRFSPREVLPERIALAELAGTPDQLRDRSLYVGDLFASMVVGNLVLPSAALVTRERLERVGGFDESVQVAGEDFDFFLRTCREGPVAFADVPSVLYQVGRSDQLTHRSNGLPLARNYVRTMEQAIARDPNRIDLSSATMRDGRASGYAWTGLAYLEAGDSRAARRYLLRSLRLRPADRRTLAMSAVALAPGFIRARVLVLLRRLKDLVSGRA